MKNPSVGVGDSHTGRETIIVTVSLEGRGRQGRVLEVLLVALAFALVNVASAYFQEPISLLGGRGWDGATYSQVAEPLHRGERPSGRAPFVYRFGAPYLVSIVLRSGIGVIQAFKVVNLVGNALGLLLLIVWLRLYLADWRIRALLALLFITQWHAPIRYVHYYPTLVES